MSHISQECANVASGVYSAPVDHTQEFNDFSGFVVERILNHSPNRVCLLGFVMPSAALAQAAIQVLVADPEFSQANAAEKFPLDFTSIPNPTFSDDELVAVREIMTRCKADPCLLILTFRGFDKSVSSKVSSMEVSRFQANHPFSSFNLVGGLSPADLSVGAEVIWPADPRSISKYTFSPSSLISETPAMYLAAHVPFMESQIARPFHLGWVHAILDLKKETDAMLLMDIHPDNGFVLHPDTKWVTFKQIQAVAPAIDNLAKDGHIVGTFDASGAEVATYPRLGLNEPFSSDSLGNALPFELIRALHMLVLVNRRDIRCLRDLNASHLPLLRNVRAGVKYLAARKLGIPPTDVMLYMHYAPTFYHLHIHVNHVSNYEATPAAKTILLDDVIANIELCGDYYQRATLTFRAPTGMMLPKALREASL